MWSKPFRKQQPDVRVGSSSAVTAVLFHRGDASTPQETKAGSYIYRGDAAHFHEWEFRTSMRAMGKRNDAYADAVSRIVEGLRGDAFSVAQELGKDAKTPLATPEQKRGQAPKRPKQLKHARLALNN